jgi:uncharacterized protein with HEPN domain
MRSESVKFALYDIRDNILFAREIVDGFTCERFIESRLHFYAVTRALEIISEASRRLPDNLPDRHPQLPWRSIRDVGNFYRHQYDNVAASYVWETVSVHLPPSLAVVLTEIEAMETES